MEKDERKKRLAIHREKKGERGGYELGMWIYVILAGDLNVWFGDKIRNQNKNFIVTQITCENFILIGPMLRFKENFIWNENIFRMDENNRSFPFRTYISTLINKRDEK